MGTRPMTDRVKESLFGTLASMGYPQAGDRVLDLYAGTGSLGIEALSRGASWCDFVEQNAGVARIVAENLASTRLAAQGAAHAMPVEAYLRAIGGGRGTGQHEVKLPDPRRPSVGRGRDSLAALPPVARPRKSDNRPSAEVKCDIIFMDPPYADPDIQAILNRLAGTAFLAPEGVLVVGHARGVPMPATIGNLAQVRHKVFGGSAFSLYRYADQVAADNGSGVGGRGSDDEGADDREADTADWDTEDDSDSDDD
jgi:16S rRNA G966 N2-methylase RsmD